MYSVDVYVNNPSLPTAKIEQLKVKREWMENTIYNCTPVVAANTFGYGIYFEEDLSFIWDGDTEVPARALKGENVVRELRGGGTVSFDTNLLFKTDENTSLLTIPVPNQPIEDVTVISNILSTSFFSSVLPVVWKLEVPHKEYFVPAGTYVACIIPISIAQFHDSTINIHDKTFPFRHVHGDQNYTKALKDAQKEGKFLKLYQKGIDHLGKTIGAHEIKKLNLNVNYSDRNQDD